MSSRSHPSDERRRSCKYPHCAERSTRRGMCNTHYRRYEKVRQTLEGTNKIPWCHPYDYHCVYVVGCDELEYVKIGRSNNIYSRLEQLQCGMPFKLKIYGARFSHPEIIIALEYSTHSILTECDTRYRAEWFDVDPKDAIAAVDKCAAISNLECYTPEDYDNLCRQDMGTGLTRPKQLGEDESRERLVREIRSAS